MTIAKQEKCLLITAKINVVFHEEQFFVQTSKPTLDLKVSVKKC